MDSYTLYKYLHNMCQVRRCHYDVLPADGLDSVIIKRYPVCLIVNNEGLILLAYNL